LTHQKTLAPALRPGPNKPEAKAPDKVQAKNKARNAKNSAKFVSEDRCPYRWWTGWSTGSPCGHLPVREDSYVPSPTAHRIANWKCTPDYELEL